MSSFNSIFRGLREIFGKDEATTFAVKSAGLGEYQEDGGPGSGNWGHAGRPGKRGGSGKGKGKGSGLSMRVGSRETGFTSVTKAPHYEKLVNLARREQTDRSDKFASKRSFALAISLDEELDQIMREQHAAACPNEGYHDYLDRMFDMLNARVLNEKPVPNLQKIERSLQGEEAETWRVLTLGSTPGATIRSRVNHYPDPRAAKEILDIVGKHTGWSKTLLDRNFERLTEQQKKDMNTLLDRHPWSSDERMAKIPKEVEIYIKESWEVGRYYNALKAKAMGIGGIYIPDRPEGLDTPKDRLGDWQSKLDEADKRRVDHWLDGGKTTVPEFLDKVGSFSRRNMLNMIAKTTDWSDRLKDRQFEGLEETEKKDLDYILDRYPYFGDPANLAKYGPDEEEIQAGLEKDTLKYYDMLKAKAMGVPGIKVPPRPKALEYAMTHPKISETIAAQDSGYVHTPAGDKHRAAVKAKFESSEISSKIFGDVTEEMRPMRDRIIQSVDNMDDRMAELVSKTVDGVSVGWLNNDGTSCYHSNGYISLYTRKPDGSMRTPDEIARTFWHEYGHFVDDEYNSHAGFEIHDNPLHNGLLYPGMGVTDSVVTEKQYQDAARKDIQNLLELAGLSEEFTVQHELNEYSSKVTIVRKSDRKEVQPHVYDEELSDSKFRINQGIEKVLQNALGYDETLNFMQNHGAPAEVEYDDYYETYVTPKRRIVRTRPKFKGAEEAYRQARMERDQKWDEWIESIGGQDAYFELAHERDAAWKAYEAKRRKMGNVTDCIDDAVNGLFALMAVWGAHDTPYYRSKGKPIETAANMFSIRAMNDPDVNDFMSKTIPNISALFTRAWRANYEDGKEKSDG